MCFCSTPFKKNFDFDFDYLLFWGDQFIPLDFCLISMITLKCGFVFPTIYSCFNFQLFDYPDPCFDQYTSFQYFIQPKLEIFKFIV